MFEPPQSVDNGTPGSRPDASDEERIEGLERENARLREALAVCRENERALQRSNERLARVLEVENVGVMFWDLSTGCLVDANDTFLNLMGYSREEVEACELTWQKLTPPEYMDLSRAEVEKFLASGRVGPYEKEYLRKDGTRRWFVFAGSSLGENSCVEFCVDIADRKRAEAALRESEARLRLIADALPVLVSYVDNEERYRFANATYEQWFGLPRDQLIGQPVAEVLGAAAYEQVREHMQRALAGERVHYLVHMPYQRGPARETEAIFVPHKDESGNVLGFYALVQDISELIEHKRAEEALRESERKYRALVENLYEGIWLIDQEERTSFVNARMAELLGYPAEEMLGRDLFSFMSPQDAEAARQNLARGRTGVRADYDFEFRCKDGRPIWTHIVTTPLFGADGEYQGALAGVVDITERKQAEEALRRAYAELEATLAELRAAQQQIIQSEKLAALGTLAAGVAHELNNPLMGIMGYVAVARRSAKDPEAERLLARAGRELERMSDLLRSMLGFARPVVEGKLSAVDIAPVLERTLALLRPEFKVRDITVITEVATDLPKVTARAEYLQQVLLNLLMNARDAVEGRPERQIRIAAGQRNEQVAISITDSGPGIPPERQERIFDPFFTTKHPGTGTGLGLSIARSIVADLGGSVTCDSREGEGATFTVALPIAHYEHS